jgi:hypothetical protein
MRKGFRFLRLSTRIPDAVEAHDQIQKLCDWMKFVDQVDLKANKDKISICQFLVKLISSNSPHIYLFSDPMIVGSTNKNHLSMDLKPIHIFTYLI